MSTPVLASTPPPEEPPSSGPKLYHCGPLAYTKIGLTTLFAWLLWGDFCFTLMETVGGVVPLKLKALGATNTTMSIVLSVLPNILNFTICPWVSFRSDRYRSRWGRRIPFILWTMPFLVLCLVLLGWSETLTPFFQNHFSVFKARNPATVTILLIALFSMAFSFFNMFVGSVYWYLFNDVVPPQYLGTFMGCFRIVGTIAGAFYNYFIFRYAETNMREIITGGALLYLFGFGLMCLFVKEGPYPPPPDSDDQPKGVIKMIKAFGKQSFALRFYWLFYLMSAFTWMSWSCGMFNVFFSKEMGLTVGGGEIGNLAAFGAIATLVASFFAGVFVDRWHPLRITTYMAVFAAVTGFGSWIWVFVTLPDLYFWLSLGGSLVFTFGNNLSAQCEMVLFMRLFPKSLYGQFCSANALTRSVASMISGVCAGVFMDAFTEKWGFNLGNFGYRFMFLWPWFFTILRTIFTCWGYREWQRLGGDESYRPPAPWKEDGYDEVADKVKSVPPKPRAVMLSMWLQVAGSAFNVMFVTVFLYYMWRHGLIWAFRWHLMYFIPIKLVLTAATYVQLLHVRRDVEAHEAGKTTRWGVPHHGVLLVNAIQGLLYFPIYWLQSIWMIKLGLERELILFSIASLLSTIAGIAGIQIIRWIERAQTSPRPTPTPAPPVKEPVLAS